MEEKHVVQNDRPVTADDEEARQPECRTADIAQSFYTRVTMRADIRELLERLTRK
jgi:hypothetical protein